MKKTILTNLKYIAFGLVLAFGANALAQWSGPASGAYGGNVPLPIHSGPDQVKDGGISVADFIVSQNAAFSQGLAVKGSVRGGSGADANSTVYVGNASVGATTDILVSGALAAAGPFASQSVANNESRNLCADASGTIHLCGADVCSNIAGLQTTIPAGYQTSGTNCVPIDTSIKRYMTTGYNKLVEWNVPQGGAGGWQSQCGGGCARFTTIPLDTSNIVINKIPGFIPTTLSHIDGDVGKVIWNVQETGTYYFKFLQNGWIQTYTVERGNTVVGVDFFLKINGQTIDLIPPGTQGNCGAIFSPTAQISIVAACEPRGSLFGHDGLNTGRKHTATVYYNVNYAESLNLNAGDTVELYASARGWSQQDSFFDSHYRGFSFRVHADQTILDVTR